MDLMPNIVFDGYIDWSKVDCLDACYLPVEAAPTIVPEIMEECIINPGDQSLAEDNLRLRSTSTSPKIIYRPGNPEETQITYHTCLSPDTRSGPLDGSEWHYWDAKLNCLNTLSPPIFPPCRSQLAPSYGHMLQMNVYAVFGDSGFHRMFKHNILWLHAYQEIREAGTWHFVDTLLWVNAYREFYNMGAWEYYPIHLNYLFDEICNAHLPFPIPPAFPAKEELPFERTNFDLYERLRRDILKRTDLPLVLKGADLDVFSERLQRYIIDRNAALISEASKMIWNFSATHSCQYFECYCTNMLFPKGWSVNGEVFERA